MLVTKASVNAQIDMHNFSSAPSTPIGCKSHPGASLPNSSIKKRTYQEFKVNSIPNIILEDKNDDVNLQKKRKLDNKIENSVNSEESELQAASEGK
jgi:hypothetical protein